jgi:hypothetical protein
MISMIAALRTSKNYETRGLRAWIRERNVRRQMMRYRQTVDALVISFPKSGRTWLRLLVGVYLCRVLAVDDRGALDVRRLTARAGLLRLGVSHNGASPQRHLPLSSPLVASPIEWADRQVFLLVREAADVMVSAFHHMHNRSGRYDGDLSNYIRHPTLGLPKYLVALRRWSEQRSCASGFTIIGYRELQADPVSVLRSVLIELGQKQIDESLLRETVEFCSFRNMKRLELEGYFKGGAMLNRKGTDQSAKVRVGEVGSSRRELSAADLEYVERSVSEAGLSDDISRLIRLPHDS